jgi:hypothetical protein
MAELKCNNNTSTRTSFQWWLIAKDVQVRILINLQAHTLCALKAVCREMANTCRHVLCSNIWLDTAQNAFYMQELLRSSTQQIQFPFTVSLLAKELGQCCHVYHGYYVDTSKPYLLATIHSLSIISLNTEGERVKGLIDIPGFAHELIDFCIEVHGYGIVFSETQLRVLLQDILRERGIRRFPQRKTWGPFDKYLPTLLTDLEVEYEPDGTWSMSSGIHHDDHIMSTIFLLAMMKIVTKVSKDRWFYHTIPLTERHLALSVHDIVQWQLGPFAM